MGPQGSGKGTQGQLLSQEMNIPIIGAGALLRDEIASGSELGVKIKSIIDPGNLVPAEIITELLDKRLKKDDAKNGALIDGYPRDARQLDLLFERMTPDLAIVLELNDEDAVMRLGGRWMCPDGHIWNMNSNPPKENGRCDDDGKELFQRDDDKEEAIRLRLNIYRNDTAPLIAGLAEHGVNVARIDASGPIEEVHDKIKSILE